jgi:AmmeMemoRadiSam system protein A
MLTEVERGALLRLARDTVAAHLSGGAPPPPVQLDDPQAHSGAFVTLHVNRELRGCIGHPGSDRPLDEVVGRCAIAAATEDPRFPPLTAAELPDVKIEISVLTPIRRVDDVRDIEVGRDGLIVQDGYKRGLLLPQVASERGWDRETFLSHTCLKAGLRPDAWRTGAKISSFQAEVFSERSERGE